MYLSTMPICNRREKNCRYKHNNIQTLFLEFNKNCGSPQNYTKYFDFISYCAMKGFLKKCSSLFTNNGSFTPEALVIEVNLKNVCDNKGCVQV